MTEFLLRVATVMSIWSILIVSLNLQIGYTGLLSLAQAAFWGIGAYTYAILTRTFGLGFLAAAAAAIALAGAAGLLIALPSLRLKGLYFLIASLGFQLVVYGVLQNWIEVTRGPLGFYGIPRPIVLGTPFETTPALLALCGVLAAGAIVLAYRLGASPVGLALKAIREDELAAAAVGKPVTRFKVQVFVFAAMLAALAGALFAGYITAIDPAPFHVNASLTMIAIVIIGGAGNIKGSVLGVIVFLAVPEVLRFLDLPSTVAGQLRQMIVGLLLVLFVLLRPRGLVGEYELQ